MLEDLAHEWEVLRPDLPEGRDHAVDDAVREQPPLDARFPLHRPEIPLRVPASKRHPRDEVVEHEVVQNDDARPSSESFDDPRVRIGVVSHVVETDVADGGTTACRDLDVEAALQRRQQ
jgi:hypothetical protein